MESLRRDFNLSLMRSVLVGILDPDNRLQFVRDKILSNFQKMRTEITNLFCHGIEEGLVPRDSNIVTNAARKDQDPSCPPCQPTEQQPSPNMFAIGKGGTFRCWSCDPPDFAVKDCPIPLIPEVAERLRTKGAGKGGNMGGFHNQWNSRGKGKDNKGEGKGPYNGFQPKGKAGGKGLRSPTPTEEQWTAQQWAE